MAVYNAIKNDSRYVVAAGGAGLMLVGQAVHAALPASVGTTVTSIQTDGQAVFDLVFPVIAVFVGLVVVIKLFKRFANKM